MRALSTQAAGTFKRSKTVAAARFNIDYSQKIKTLRA